MYSLYSLILLCLANSGKGQSVSQIEFEKSIDNCFRTNDKLIKDSVLIYAFNFQLVGKRDANGRISIGSVTCNDSLAYKIFPDYKRLSKVDFSKVVGKHSDVRIVIPVVLFYKNHDQKATISVDAALNAALALLSPVSYDNEKEKFNYFGYQVHSQFEKNNNYDKLLSRSIFLPLRYVEIHRIE